MPKGAPVVHDRADQRVAEARGHAQLVGELAREGEPVEPPTDPAADRDGAGGEIGEGLVRHVLARVDQRAHHFPRTRPGDGVLRPLLGDRHHLHVELGPDALVAEFEVLHDLDRVGRGRRHEVVVVGEARGGAVVEREAVLAEHQAVARLADRQRREGVGIDPVEEHARRPAPARRSCRGSRHRRPRPARASP